MYRVIAFVIAFAAALFAKNQTAQILSSFVCIFLFISILTEEIDEDEELVILDQPEQEFPITEFNTTMGASFPASPADGDIHFLDVVRDGVEDVEVWRYTNNEWNHLQ